jgi:hypothetical protein
MNNRLRLGTPKQTLAVTSGKPMRPISLPCGLALVELAEIRRIGEPDGAVRVRDNVIGRVEPFAVVGIGDERRRTVANLPCRITLMGGVPGG